MHQPLDRSPRLADILQEGVQRTGVPHVHGFVARRGTRGGELCEGGSHLPAGEEAIDTGTEFLRRDDAPFALRLGEGDALQAGSSVAP